MLQVYASYRYRRDLADAAKISGVFGRSRILKREEASRQEVSMPAAALLCPAQFVLLFQSFVVAALRGPLIGARNITDTRLLS